MPRLESSGRRSALLRGGAIVLGASLMLPGGVPEPPTASSGGPLTGPAAARRAHVTAPDDGTAVVAGEHPIELAVGTSTALYDDAPIVVLAGEDNLDAQARGASVAVALGVPLLPAPGTPVGDGDGDGDGDGEGDGEGEDGAADGGSDEGDGSDGDAGDAVRDELARLAPDAVLTVGAAATGWARGAVDGATVVPAPSERAALAARTGAALGDAQAVTTGGLVEAAATLAPDAVPLLRLDPDPGTERPDGGSAPDAEAGGSAGTDGDDGAAVGNGDGSGEAASGTGDADVADAAEAGAGDAGAAQTGGAGEHLALPAVTPQSPSPVDALLVLAERDPAALAAVATARAAGADVVATADVDPRARSETVAAVAERSPGPVLALGSAFGPAARLRRRLDVAATGVELPGGGQVLYPGRRMVALYGHPGTPALGALGEQPVDEAVARAQRLADDYQALVDAPVVPAFEIIATVASEGPGPDGNFSNEAEVAELRPWVDAAAEAGVYVVLDLQPGRTDFLTQAQRYEELLVEPHVGLALDPEWRLDPGQRHMAQIGSVGAAEVNTVADWLAELTRDEQLPQKLLLLHQFQIRMITDRDQVETGHDELGVLIHADGFGTAGQKFATWDRLRADPPPDVWWGWKNFIDEDRPTFTPQRTVAIEPSPVFVSYQ